MNQLATIDHLKTDIGAIRVTASELDYFKSICRAESTLQALLIMKRLHLKQNSMLRQP